MVMVMMSTHAHSHTHTRTHTHDGDDGDGNGDDEHARTLTHTHTHLFLARSEGPGPWAVDPCSPTKGQVFFNGSATLHAPSPPLRRAEVCAMPKFVPKFLPCPSLTCMYVPGPPRAQTVCRGHLGVEASFPASHTRSKLLSRGTLSTETNYWRPRLVDCAARCTTSATL